MVKKLLEDKREREIYQWDALHIRPRNLLLLCVFFLGFALFFFSSWGAVASSLFYGGQSRNLKDFEGPVCSFWAVGLA